VEVPDCQGLLITSSQVEANQVKKGSLWEGQIPTCRGDYHGYYQDVVKAIRGERKQYITAETARDNLRIIELARQSWQEGKTLPMD
jgi:predicted dehydrogenase